jgi:hypothetical protein
MVKSYIIVALLVMTPSSLVSEESALVENGGVPR